MTDPASGSRTSDDLSQLVLGGSPVYDAEGIASRAGLATEDAVRIWRAMGFADVGDAVAFTESDLQALLTLLSLTDEEGFGLEDAIEIVRSLGQTTSRLAQWQVDTFAQLLDRNGRLDASNGLQSEEVDQVFGETAKVLPRLETLLVHAYRRQLEAALTRNVAYAEAFNNDETVLVSVAFADLVGFTRLAKRLPEDELAALVQNFESVSADVVASHGARVVKTLGDEVMFAGPDASGVVRAAIELHQAHASSDEVPELRIGIATGEVIYRMGDVFGTTVNLANRLTAIARPGTTLVDASTVDSVEDDELIAVKALRPRPVRGFGLLRAWTANKSEAVIKADEELAKEAQLEAGQEDLSDGALTSNPS